MNSLGSLLAGLLALQDDGGSFWLPPKSSSVAGQVDAAFYFIYWICVIFFVLIVGLMVVFAIRYRAREGQVRKKAPHHNLALELTWTLIPLVLVIAIFWNNFKTFLSLETPPGNAMEVTVIAQKWQWLFKYPNGFVDSELHVPAAKPVTLTLRSEDVIHSFYIPDFRIKKDVVPGRYNKVWFEAKEPGEHWLLCAEYCGTSHSDMISRVIVHDDTGYTEWLANAEKVYYEMPPAQAGAEMFKRYGCTQCHSIDGTAGTGPSLKDVYGEPAKLASGESPLVDENYLRESILDPGAKVVAGYQAVMPTFQGKLKDEQIDWLIAYIKTLSSHTPPAELDAAKAAPAPTAEAGAVPAAEAGTAPPAGTESAPAPGAEEGAN